MQEHVKQSVKNDRPSHFQRLALGAEIFDAPAWALKLSACLNFSEVLVILSAHNGKITNTWGVQHVFRYAYRKIALQKKKHGISLICADTRLTAKTAD